MALLFNYYTQFIEVEAPQTVIEVQDLINAIRAAEFNWIGFAYPKIAEGNGKDALGANVFTGITVYLYPNWQIKFPPGNYVAQIRGGNLIGGPGGNPVAYTPGVNVQLIQSSSATLLNAALTDEEHNKLMTGLDVSVPQAVWAESLENYNTALTAGKTVKQIKTSAQLAAIK